MFTGTKITIFYAVTVSVAFIHVASVQVMICCTLSLSFLCNSSSECDGKEEVGIDSDTFCSGKRSCEIAAGK